MKYLLPIGAYLCAAAMFAFSVWKVTLPPEGVDLALSALFIIVAHLWLWKEDSK